jgi:hypothetical protein
MNEEDKSQSSTDKKEIKQVVNDKVTISETVYVKLEKAKELLNKAKEHEKRAEVLESERKKDEEDLNKIRRKYNIT